MKTQTQAERARKVTRPGKLALVGLLAFAAPVARPAAEGIHPELAANPSAHRVDRARPKDEASTVDIQRFRNLGKAYYEQGKYPEAVEQFEQVIGSGEAFAVDHLDLGLGLMQANQLDAALGELTTARQMDPKLLAVHYNLGILYKRELRYPDSEAELKHVVGADPKDPAAWFNLGTVYFAEKKLPESLDAFQRVLAMGFGRAQNFYVAATFHVFTVLTRLKRPEEAQKYLKLNQEYRDKVPGISVQYPALEAGPYGMVLVPAAAPVSAPAAPEKLRFADITARLGLHLPAHRPALQAPEEIQASAYSLEFARRRLLPLFPPSVAIGDYDGDGRPDVYVVVPGEPNHLLHNNGDGTFTDVTAKSGVAGGGGGLAATFADYNNSGHPSLIVAGLGGVTLYRNRGDGTFEDATAESGLAGKPGELDTRVIAFDSDNDGFLDLVVTAYANLDAPPRRTSFHFPDDFPPATSHLYRNDADGTFSDIASAAGLTSLHGRMRSAVFADFNDDGYADLVFLRDGAPPLLYLNEGEDHFVDATAQAGPDFTRLGAVDAQVVDFNHDGEFDLVFWSHQGYSVLLGRGNAQFQAIDLPPPLPLPRAPFAPLGTTADLRGDGFDSLAALDADGRLHVVLNEAGRLAEATEIAAVRPGGQGSPRQPTLASLTPSCLTDPGRLDLLAAYDDGELHVFEKQGPPARWAEVTLEGSKSNKPGVGSVVEFKSGNYYKKVIATGGPVRVFTDELNKLDVVRVTWPNLVVENSIGVATDHKLEVRESERLASSCPFLYVWNGQRYTFLTDIMGVAPLGELAPDGSRVRPNPDQVVRLGAAPQIRDDTLVLQITDEMRESDYFDALRLVALDHPAAVAVYANEVYSSAPVPPELYAVRQERAPLSAVDDRGHDVLPLLRRVDGRYPADFRHDRILGLGETHSLTLDLGPFPASANPALWLTGWVFWTDSNASRALAANRRLTMIPPYLQVRDDHGRWVTVVPDLGLPSGTERTFRVDLAGKFLSPDHHLRIVTNLCVYWDRAFFSTDDVQLPDALRTSGREAGEISLGRHGPQARVLQLPLATADLHYRGFSTPLTDPRHLRPDSFDYIHRLGAAPWNPFGGRYTRYGPVETLITRADDHLVVMAAGDELTVEFDARRLEALNRGWCRDYFLYARGYAKDGEPNTADFRTVEPLPFYRMSNYPYEPGQHYPDDVATREYLLRYETRSGYTLVPPLKPAVP